MTASWSAAGIAKFDRALGVEHEDRVGKRGEGGADGHVQAQQLIGGVGLVLPQLRGHLVEDTASAPSSSRERTGTFWSRLPSPICLIEAVSDLSGLQQAAAQADVGHQRGCQRDNHHEPQQADGIEDVVGRGIVALGSLLLVRQGELIGQVEQ